MRCLLLACALLFAWFHVADAKITEAQQKHWKVTPDF